MPNLATILLAAGLFQNPVPPSVLPAPPNSDKVVARLNGTEIRAGDVAAFLWDWRAQEVTQDLITYQLILGEAKRQKVEVPPADVEREFAARVAEAGSDDALRAQGFPKSRLYMRVQTDLLVNRMLMAEFRPAEYVRVSAAPFRSLAGQKESPQQRAEKAHAQLAAGGKWEDVVKDTEGGVMGWRAVSAFPEAAAKELKGLRAGGYTRPVPMSDGSVNLYRVEMRGDGATGEEAQELQESYLTTGRSKLLKRLRDEAKIERPG